VIYSVLFILLVIFGFWASRKNWKKEKGEILERIKKMRQEIEMKG
jgi:aspartate/tyrosine/aromatic aminotransferase